MLIDFKKKNRALESIFNDPTQIIFLDANFFIPPDRGIPGVKFIDFPLFSRVWLDSIFEEFSSLSVHETVMKELVDIETKEYSRKQLNTIPSRLKVYEDDYLTKREKALLGTYIHKLSVFSKYEPEFDNSSDRGEIRLLSFMAVKNFLYFASNDNLPALLIGHAKELHTGLENMELLRMYDVIFYLHHTGRYTDKGLRLLYKYQYYLTKSEKSKNPNWFSFIEQMNDLYFPEKENN